MEFVRLSLLYVHLLGMALLVGGIATQIFARQLRVNTAMIVGVITQLITGFLLAAPLGRDEQPSAAKLGVKMLLAVLIAIMVVVPRNREKLAPGHFYATAGMAAVTVGVAVFWT